MTQIITLPLLNRFWNNAKLYISNSISAALTKAVLIDTTFYLGAGSSVNNVMVDDNKYVKNKNIKSGITLNCNNQKIYFIIPITGYVITMSNIPIPVDVNQTTVDNVTYNVYSSKNTYTGELSLQIHKLNN